MIDNFTHNIYLFFDSVLFGDKYILTTSELKWQVAESQDTPRASSEELAEEAESPNLKTGERRDDLADLADPTRSTKRTK